MLQQGDRFIVLKLLIIYIRLGEALSDSEIEKSDNTCTSRRSSSGTNGVGSVNRKTLRPRVGFRRRHNSSGSDGSMLNNLSSITSLKEENSYTHTQSKKKYTMRQMF